MEDNKIVIEKLIQQNIGEAGNAGIRGTPSFLINGLSVVGAQPYNEFQRLIESELE